MRFLIVSALCASLAAPVFAQGASIAFGSTKQDSSAPVEVAADNLSINQNTGAAVLTGNVVIGQGPLRLSASKVNVTYTADRKQISKLVATGNVVLVSGDDAAEAAQADYDVNGGLIVLSGNVLLVQGPTAVTADRMRINTSNGTAQMSGRVKTVLNAKN